MAPETTSTLVVADEPAIRGDIRQIVERSGQRVVEASGPDEALLLLSTGGIGTVIADLEMLGEDGLWLARAIHSKWPEIKLVVISGRTMPPRSQVPADIPVLGKPLSAERLLSVLARL